MFGLSILFVTLCQSSTSLGTIFLSGLSHKSKLSTLTWVSVNPLYCIKYNIEIECPDQFFLLYNQYGNIAYLVYRRPMHTNRYSKGLSHHPPVHTLSVIISLHMLYLPFWFQIPLVKAYLNHFGPCRKQLPKVPDLSCHLQGTTHCHRCVILFIGNVTSCPYRMLHRDNIAYCSSLAIPNLQLLFPLVKTYFNRFKLFEHQAKSNIKLDHTAAHWKESSNRPFAPVVCLRKLHESFENIQHYNNFNLIQVKFGDPSTINIIN